MTQENEAPDWKQFEYHCWYLFQRWYPEDEDWEIEYQVQAESVKPDFVIRHHNQEGDFDAIVIVDAKDRQRLSQSDIDQVLDYAEEFEADEIKLMVAWDTEYSEDINDEAKTESVEIRKTEWRCPGSRCYCYDPDEDTIRLVEWEEED